MTVKLDGLDEWEASMRTAMSHRIVATARLESVDGGAVEDALEGLAQPQFFLGVLEKLVAEKILSPQGGVLYQKFHQNTENENYLPHFIPKEDVEAGNFDGDIPLAGGGKMRSGFDALWAAISGSPKFFVQGDLAVAGVGPMSDVLRLQLNDYMGTSGSAMTRSPLNSLFHAVEFGTGTAEHVGAPQFVRRRTPTRPHKAEQPEGAWWFGPNGSSARHYEAGDEFLRAAGETSAAPRKILMTGQKGLHFLYDARTRVPHQFYTSAVARWLPSYIRKALAGRAGVRLRGAE